MADMEYPQDAGEVVVKSRTEQLIEGRYQCAIPVLLRRLYQDEGLTQSEIADKLDISRWTVVEWMKRHGIPTVDRRAIASTEGVS